MKKLMILGAGIYQVPLIKKARAMGLETIVVSIDGPYPGFKYADKIYKYDTRDVEAILAAAICEDIDGIVTTGTDVAVKAIGFVTDAMKLPGISERSARLLTDKADMKTAFSHGVSTTPFRIVRSEEEAREAAEAIGYPVMVKACDVSGSRGISRVDDESTLAGAVTYAFGATHTDHILVEKVAEGYEIGVDGFVRNGEILLCLPHDKFIKRCGTTTVPAGHSFPFKGSETLKAAIRREFEAVVRTTGLNNCAVNMDVFVEGDDKVMVLEAGGRCGATTIPELISIYTGVDYYAGMISCALGEPFDFTPREERPCMGCLLTSPVDGIITDIDEEKLREIQADGAVFSLDYGKGAAVHKMKDGTDRIGQLIMPTDRKEVLEKTARRILSCLSIEE